MAKANVCGISLITRTKNISIICVHMYVYVYLHMCLFITIDFRVWLEHKFQLQFAYGPNKASIHICMYVYLQLKLKFVLFCGCLNYYYNIIYLSSVCVRGCVWVNLRKLCGYLWLIECINLNCELRQMRV